MAGMSVSGVGAAIASFESLKKAFGNDGENAVYIVGTNVEYAAYVEFGTSKMQAQPYLFPAARRVGRDPEKYISNPRSTAAMVRQVALAIEREAKDDAPVDTGRLRASIEAKPVAAI